MQQSSADPTGRCCYETISRRLIKRRPQPSCVAATPTNHSQVDAISLSAQSFDLLFVIASSHLQSRSRWKFCSADQLHGPFQRNWCSPICFSQS